MRLITKSSLYFIPAILLVFFLSGVFLHSFLENLIFEEVEENLAKQRTLFLQQVTQLNSFSEIPIPLDKTIEIGKETDSIWAEPEFSDTLIYSDHDNEYVPYLQIIFNAAINNEFREIIIRQSLLESDDLIEGLIISLGAAFLIMIVVFSIINYMIAKKVWSPFRKILNNMKNFSFQRRNGYEPIKTDITEFNELNNELSKMTAKLTHDYFALKEFSENASHEMQTPLAVIQAKLELLFQQQGISEENLNALNSAYQAANRLARLHHELNLLSRIENMEFKDRNEIDLKTLLEKQIENFTDIIDQKKITCNILGLEKTVIRGNSYLMEILLSNLLNNAIKHNIPQGQINIKLKDNLLTIANSGPPPAFSTETLFERFKKGQVRSDSSGLGLAIVKQIALVHEFRIEYQFENELHVLKLYV